jgi:hypothetical protein
MAHQFDEISNAVTRRCSRRWVLRGMIGGVVGATFVGWMASSNTPGAEAGAPQSAPLALGQGENWNQGRPRLNQRRQPLGHGGPKPNQGKPEINQRGRRIDPNDPKLNQVHPHFNQQRPTFDQTHPWFGGLKPSSNQNRPPGSSGVRPLEVNQTRKP